MHAQIFARGNLKIIHWSWSQFLPPGNSPWLHWSSLSWHHSGYPRSWPLVYAPTFNRPRPCPGSGGNIVYKVVCLKKHRCHSFFSHSYFRMSLLARVPQCSVMYWAQQSDDPCSQLATVLSSFEELRRWDLWSVYRVGPSPRSQDKNTPWWPHVTRAGVFIGPHCHAQLHNN